MKQNYTNLPKHLFGFVHFAHIFLLTILLVCGLTFCFYTLSRRQVETDRADQITQSCLLIDEKIKKELQNYLQSTLNPPISSLNTFSSFFSDSASADSGFFQKIRLDLYDHWRLKNDYFFDMLLYRTSDNSFVSATRTGYSLESTYSQTSFNYTDLHELVTLNEPQIPMFYRTENLRLYYLFPVFRHPSGQTPYYAGFAALYLNPEQFFNLNMAFPRSNGTSLVINNDEIIYISGENILSEKTILNVTKSLADTSQKQHQPLKQTFFSTEYCFYYSKSELNGLIYLYYEPTLSLAGLLFDFQNGLTVMYWIIISVMSVLLSVILLQRRRLNSHAHADLIAEKTAFEKELSGERDNYIFKTSLDFLYGNISADALDRTLCRILDSDKPDKYTSCIVIEPEPITLLKMTAEQKSVFLSEVNESVRMHLEVTADTHSAILQYPQQQITCIINSNSFLPESLAHNILEHLSGVYSCRFNVFCTTPCISLADIPRCYTSVLRGAKYSYIYNYNNLFTQDNIERYESADHTIDNGLPSKLEGFLREHDFDGFSQYLAELPQYIRENGFSYIRVQDHYRTLFSLTVSYCSCSLPDYPYRDIPFSDLLSQFETIDECTDFLMNCVTVLSENDTVSDKKEQEASISKKFIDRITEYVDENIVYVTLAGTAEQFGISTAHLSRIFKDNAGINFSDYVAEKKLQKAVELLLSDSSLNIGNIAKTLGYNTPAYFSRKFKEKFGLTPAMYRKKYMADRS